MSAVGVLKMCGCEGVLSVHVQALTPALTGVGLPSLSSAWPPFLAVETNRRTSHCLYGLGEGSARTWINGPSPQNWEQGEPSACLSHSDESAARLGDGKGLLVRDLFAFSKTSKDLGKTWFPPGEPHPARFPPYLSLG